MTRQRLFTITAIMTILLSAGYWLRERVWVESSPAASSEVPIVDREGNISWRAEGAFTPEKGEALTRAIEARQGQDSTISQLNLEDYRWQNRLILIFAPNSKDETFLEQRRLLADQPAEAAERDLLIFSLFEEEPGRLNESSISVAANRDARDRFKVVPGSFAVLLIGKDGGVKLHSRQLVSSGEIFGLIDTMPMRQREMQEQFNANP